MQRDLKAKVKEIKFNLLEIPGLREYERGKKEKSPTVVRGDFLNL